MSKLAPAAAAAGPKAENTPAPIIAPSPITTASPFRAAGRAARRCSSHRGCDAFRGVGELRVGHVRQHVLPERQHHPLRLDHAERPGQEPHVEVRPTVAPAVEVNTSDVAERQNRTLDASDNAAELLLQRLG